MFSLHETTKIHLCRLAFVALCLAPTCLVLAWSVQVRLPGFRLAHEQAIATSLGLRASLKKVSTPRPGLILYEGLELGDPETGQPLARLPFVEVQASRKAIELKLPFPAIVNGTRLDAFWNAARDRMRGEEDGRPIRFLAQNLTVHLSDGDQSFTDLTGAIEHRGEQSQLKLQFRRAVADQTAAQPGELNIVRRHGGTAPTSVVQLATGPTPLPCSLAASIWPAVEHLGRASAFSGRLLAPCEAGQWKTQVAGRITGIDLDLLVSRQFPHKLTGTADVQLEQATIEEGRIESAAGKLFAGPGAISRSLVASAQTHLRVQAARAALEYPDNVLPYEQMNVAFEINSQGLTLRGEVPNTRGVMLVGAERRPLVGQGSGSSTNVLDLVRTLVPQSELQVPATRETAGLTGALPVPSVVVPVGGAEPLPTAKVIGLGVGKPLRK